MNITAYTVTALSAMMKNYWKNLGLFPVKQSHYRPAEALGLHEVEASTISRQSAYEGGKVVSHTHRPPLSPRRYHRYSFLLEAAAESTPAP
jgi:hypothetical protein